MNNICVETTKEGWFATEFVHLLMIKIAILVPESCVMQAIADPRYLFSAVNQFLQAQGRDAIFDVKLVGAAPQVALQFGTFIVQTEKLLSDSATYDLVIIPALFGNMREAIKLNERMVPWIQAQHEKGSSVASLCVGAFLLGATGLLNGKKCSTHWGFYQEFRELYPEVTIVDGSIITEEGSVYSSGGANSYWNLLLYLVEKYVGRDLAILASKYFAIDIDRDSQAAFALFQGQKDHGDAAVLEAQQIIEKNVGEKLSVDELADKVAIGRRSFERRFKAATNNSVLEYMQRVRIESAKRQFESSRKNINEVMYEVGYTDTKAFRTTFKKITGLTPVEYRNKYAQA